MIRYSGQQRLPSGINICKWVNTCFRASNAIWIILEDTPQRQQYFWVKIGLGNDSSTFSLSSTWADYYRLKDGSFRDDWVELVIVDWGKNSWDNGCEFEICCGSIVLSLSFNEKLNLA